MTPLDKRPEERVGLLRMRSAVLLGAGVALWLGLALGAAPYRFRAQFHQLQGLAVGVVIGWVLGRSTAPRR